MVEQKDRGTKQTASPVSAADVAETRKDIRRASLLPPEVYHDPKILEYEQEAWFAGGWVCVGRDEDIQRKGEYFLTSLCGENIIVVRDNDQQVRAFFNFCRHRGAVLVKEETGRVPRFQCPYHAWVYDLDGTLHMPRFCDQLENFDLNEWGMAPVNVGVWQGLIFLNINNNAAPLLESLGDMPQFFDRFDLGALRRAQLIEYDVQANWKAIIENYSECYHCPGVHPQLNKITPFNMGDWIETEGPWRASWMPVVGDYDTLTMDGQMSEHGRGFLDGITEDDHKKIYYFVVWPNLLISLHPDYLMTHRVVPIAPGRTYVACEFFFDPEQMASPGFDPSDATEFWDLTNRQDWEVCELQQQGTASRAYTAGRFTAMEGGVYAFDVKVADRYANDGVLTQIEEISKADASTKLAGRIRSRAVAD